MSENLPPSSDPDRYAPYPNEDPAVMRETHYLPSLYTPYRDWPAPHPGQWGDDKNPRTRELRYLCDIASQISSLMADHHAIASANASLPNNLNDPVTAFEAYGAFCKAVAERDPDAGFAMVAALSTDHSPVAAHVADALRGVLGLPQREADLALLENLDTAGHATETPVAPGDERSADVPPA